MPRVGSNLRQSTYLDMARRDKNLNMLGYQALFHEDRDGIDRLHPILGGYKRRMRLGEYKHNIFYQVCIYGCLLCMFYNNDEVYIRVLQKIK